MAILQKGRKLTIPVVFTRENTDSHNRKVVVFLESELTIKCWDEEGYEKFELTLLKGRSGRLLKIAEDKLVPEPQLRVFLAVPNEAGGSSSEIDGFLTAKYDGLTIKTNTKEEKVLTTKEAVERINSGTVLFLNEDYSKRTIDV